MYISQFDDARTEVNRVLDTVKNTRDRFDDPKSDSSEEVIKGDLDSIERDALDAIKAIDAAEDEVDGRFNDLEADIDQLQTELDEKD